MLAKQPDLLKQQEDEAEFQKLLRSIQERNGWRNSFDIHLTSIGLFAGNAVLLEEALKNQLGDGNTGSCSATISLENIEQEKLSFIIQWINKNACYFSSLRISHGRGEYFKTLLALINGIHHPKIERLELFLVDLNALSAEHSKLFFEAIANHPSFNLFNFSDSGLWKKDIKSLGECVEIMRTRPNLKKITFWGVNETGMRDFVAKASEAEKLLYVEKKMLVAPLELSDYNRRPIFPFYLSLEQYQTFFRNFLDNRPDQLREVKCWIEDCYLENPDEDRERLRAFLNDVAFKIMMKKIIDPGNYNQLDLSGIKLDEKNIQELIETLKRKSNFQEIVFANNHLDSVGFKKCKELIICICENKKINKIIFSNNALWKYDVKSLEELFEILKNMNHLEYVQLWDSWDESLAKSLEKWKEGQRFEFLKLYVLCEGLKPGQSPQRLPSVSLSGQQCAAIFSEFLKIYPTQFWKINALWLDSIPTECRPAVDLVLSEYKLKSTLALFEKNPLNIGTLDFSSCNLTKTTIQSLKELIEKHKKNAKNFHETKLTFDFLKDFDESLILLEMFLNVIKNTDIQRLYLSNNALNMLEPENLLKLIQCIYKSPSSLWCLDLSDNKLFEKDKETLLKVLEIAKQNQGICLVLWHFHELGNSVLLRSLAANSEQCFVLAKFHMHLLSVIHMEHVSFLPFVLSTEQWLKIFIDFANNNPKKVELFEAWVEHCKVSDENNRADFQKKILQLIAEHGNIKQINFSKMTDHETTQLLQKIERNYIPNQYSPLGVSIDIADFPEGEDLDIFSRFINACSHVRRILIKDSKLKNDRIARLIIISSIKNPRINTINLEHNRLGHLDESSLLEFLNCIFSKNQFRNLELANNDFLKLDDKSLGKLIQILKEKKLESVVLWDHNEAINEIKSWDQDRQLSFVKSHFSLPRKDENYLGLGSIRFSITPDQYFALFKEVNKNSGNYIFEILNWIRGQNIAFTEEQSHELAKLHLASGRSMYNLETYKLPPKIRLELFLQAKKNNYDVEGAFGLVKTDLPASKIISIANSFKILEDDETLPIPEECTRRCKLFIDELTKVCSSLWPNSAFFTPCLQKLQDFKFKELFDVTKFENMLDWFVWTMALLTTKEGIPSNEIGVILKEIMEYPDPQGRYGLADSFINRVCKNESGIKIYSALLGSQKTWLRIPGILFSEMLLSSDEKKLHEILMIIEREGKEKDELCKQAALENEYLLAIEILQATPRGYKDGHYFKSFVAALMAIAASEGLTVREKFSLINHTFGKSQNRLDTEKLLTEYAAACRIEDEDARQKSHDSIHEKLSLINDAETMRKLPFEKGLARINSENLKSKNSHKEMARVMNAFRRSLLSDCTMLYNEIDLREQVSQWFMLAGLGNLKLLGRLKDVPQNQLKAAGRKLFGESFGLSQEELELYNSTFMGLRNEFALLTYLGKLQQLQGVAREDALNLFKEFVGSVLSENQIKFLIRRYSKHSKHLQWLFETRPNLESFWKEEESEDLESFIKAHKIKEEVFKIDYEDFLRKKIKNNHLKSEKYPTILRYLESKDIGEKSRIKEEFEKTFQKLSSEEEITSNAQLTHSKRVQKKFFDLINCDLSDKNGQIKSLNYLIKEFRKMRDEANQFINDLENLLKNLLGSNEKNKSQDITNWTVRRTSQFWDLFMSGTDVEGSCQRINGNPRLNVCLLAYMMDGKIQMIGIFNEVGEIVGRAIFRILLDRETMTPILSLEEIYPYALPTKFRHVILKFASQCAEKFNLTLTSSEAIGDSYTYPRPIVSLGNMRNMDEYVDALYGPQKQGIYVIRNAQVISLPRTEAQITANLSGYFHSEIVDLVIQYAAPSIKEQETALLFDWGARKASKKSYMVPKKTVASTVVDKKLSYENLRSELEKLSRLIGRDRRKKDAESVKTNIERLKLFCEYLMTLAGLENSNDLNLATLKSALDKKDLTSLLTLIIPLAEKCYRFRNKEEVPSNKDVQMFNAKFFEPSVPSESFEHKIRAVSIVNSKVWKVSYHEEKTGVITKKLIFETDDFIATIQPIQRIKCSRWFLFTNQARTGWSSVQSAENCNAEWRSSIEIFIPNLNQETYNAMTPIPLRRVAWLTRSECNGQQQPDFISIDTTDLLHGEEELNLVIDFLRQKGGLTDEHCKKILKFSVLRTPWERKKAFDEALRKGVTEENFAELWKEAREIGYNAGLQFAYKCRLNDTLKKEAIQAFKTAILDKDNNKYEMSQVLVDLGCLIASPNKRLETDDELHEHLRIVIPELFHTGEIFSDGSLILERFFLPSLAIFSGLNIDALDSNPMAVFFKMLITIANKCSLGPSTSQALRGNDAAFLLSSAATTIVSSASASVTAVRNAAAKPI